MNQARKIGSYVEEMGESRDAINTCKWKTVFWTNEENTKNEIRSDFVFNVYVRRQIFNYSRRGCQLLASLHKFLSIAGWTVGITVIKKIHANRGRMHCKVGINPFATGDAYMRQLFHCLQWYAGSERVNINYWFNSVMTFQLCRQIEMHLFLIKFFFEILE